jgi:uncharacterized protein (TIGR03067 family)
MKRFALTVGVTLLVIAWAQARDDKKEQDRLQGTWEVLSITVDGKEMPAERVKGAKLIIKGDHYTFMPPGGEKIEGVNKIDPSKSPKAIDATRTNGPDKDKTALGIYEVSGNELKLCLGRPGGSERPKDFKGGEGLRVYVLKRAK